MILFVRLALGISRFPAQPHQGVPLIEFVKIVFHAVRHGRHSSSDGIHSCCPGSPPQRSARSPTSPPSAPFDPEPWVSPMAAASHLLSVCIDVSPGKVYVGLHAWFFDSLNRFSVYSRRSTVTSHSPPCFPQNVTSVDPLQGVLRQAFLATTGSSDSSPTPLAFSLPALYERSLPDWPLGGVSPVPRLSFASLYRRGRQCFFGRRVRVCRSA